MTRDVKQLTFRGGEHAAIVAMIATLPADYQEEARRRLSVVTAVVHGCHNAALFRLERVLAEAIVARAADEGIHPRRVLEDVSGFLSVAQAWRIGNHVEARLALYREAAPYWRSRGGWPAHDARGAAIVAALDDPTVRSWSAFCDALGTRMRGAV